MSDADDECDSQVSNDDGDDDDAAAAAMSDSCEESDEGDGESADDDGDDDGDDDSALEQEWAAMAIQRAWRAGRVRQYALSTVATTAPRATGGVCCSCFGPIDAPSTSLSPPSPSQDTGDQVFCVACHFALTSSKTSANGHSAVASPLPKLSKLVQAEARYQDQLELLRAQRALLAQQQQEMENRKAAQMQQLAAERARARARRRLFQLALARKQRDEALKYGQQQLHTPDARPEHDDSSAGDKPKRSKRMKEILPVPFTRTLAHVALVNKSEPSSSSSSSSSGRGAQLPSLVPVHEQQQRRKQIVRQMLGCYAQDLTPLVNGHKPKPLPVPALLSPPLTSSSSSNSSSTKSSAPSQSPSSRVAPQATRQLHHPRAQPKGKKQSHVRLRPIDARVRKQQHNNQTDDRDATRARLSPCARQQLPSSSSSLTAEIKPIAWVYELGKGVFDDDARGTPALSLASFQSQQLYAVPEEENGEADHSVSSPSQQQTTASFDLQLQLRHKLPPKTVLAASSTASSGVSQSVGIADSSTTAASSQWEYSTDRLASLLEKYNVSVSAATAPSSSSTSTSAAMALRM